MHVAIRHGSRARSRHEEGMSITIHNWMQGHPVGYSQERMSILSSPCSPDEATSPSACHFTGRGAELSYCFPTGIPGQTLLISATELEPDMILALPYRGHSLSLPLEELLDLGNLNISKT